MFTALFVGAVMATFLIYLLRLIVTVLIFLLLLLVNISVLFQNLAGVSREVFISRIAIDVKAKVPLPFDLAVVRKKFEDISSKRGDVDIGPTTVVLLQVNIRNNWINCGSITNYL